MTTETKDPSRSSYYVDDAFYATLVRDFADWAIDERAIVDIAERDQFRALIEREARLLDQGQLDAWLRMFIPECVYWVPATPGGGDPRREVAVAFDDRRRLEDRVFRLKSGYAWSQVPGSRTVRMVTNVEVFRGANDDTRMVRANFLTTEFRAGETRSLAGWSGYRYVAQGGRWAISAKQVNLIECDQSLRNPSIVL
jgi:3-phenylpropionate/cinnamic acid dioxygenase small subunit